MGKVNGDRHIVKRKKNHKDLEKLHSNVLAAKAALDGKRQKRKKICDRLLPRPENRIYKYGTKGTEIQRNSIVKESWDKTNKDRVKSSVLNFFNDSSNSSDIRHSENLAKEEEEHSVRATSQKFLATIKSQNNRTPFSKLFEDDARLSKTVNENSQRIDSQSSYVIYREFCHVVSQRSFKINTFGIIQAIKNNIKQIYNRNYKKRVSNKRWTDEWAKSLFGNIIEVQACTDTDASEIAKEQSGNREEDVLVSDKSPKSDISSKKEIHGKFVSTPFQRFADSRKKEFTSLQVNYDSNSALTNETDTGVKPEREYPVNRFLRKDDFYSKHCKHVPTILRRNQQYSLPTLLENQLEEENLVQKSEDSRNLSTPNQSLKDNSDFLQFKLKYTRSKYRDYGTSDAASWNFPFSKRSLHFKNAIFPENAYDVYQRQRRVPFFEQLKDRNIFYSNFERGDDEFPGLEILKDSRQKQELSENSRKFLERRFKSETVSQSQLSANDCGNPYLSGEFNGSLEPETIGKKIGICQKEKKTYKPVQLIGYVEETQPCDCRIEDKRRVEEESLQKAVQNLRTLNFNETQNPNLQDFGHDCIQQPIKFVALDNGDQMQLRVPLYLQQKPKELVKIDEFQLLRNYQKRHSKLKLPNDAMICADDFPLPTQKGAKRVDFIRRKAPKLNDRLFPNECNGCECHESTGRVCLGKDHCFDSRNEFIFNKYPRNQKTTRRNLEESILVPSRSGIGNSGFFR